MRIVNQSRLPDAEVAELVRFAFRDTRDNGVVVKVKNARGAYRGRAYHGVPTVSPEYGKATSKQLVTIGIGPDSAFPATNVSEHSHRVRSILVPPGAFDPHFPTAGAYTAAREISELVDGEHFGGVTFPRDGGARVAVIVREQHAYGGKGSPEIIMRNWREALVSVAAHEARHVWQFQSRARGKRQPLSEVDAERYAAKRLQEYRAEQMVERRPR